MYSRRLTIAIVVMVILSLVTVAFVENIDPHEDDSQYAYGENVGWLNLEPGGDGGPGVTVTDTAVTGYMWGENIGWINLGPTSYGGVVNDGTGNLSGYAWGENVGWINFAPLTSGVTIDGQGNFNGWAWGENIGWIHFQNLSIPYKVQTAWSIPPAPCVEPPSGLVGWWPGDGDADDISGENHGTLVNGATFASGKVGQAFSLDGVDDYVQIPYDVSFNLSSFTLQAWVKFTQNTYACIISRPQGGNPTDGYSFFRLAYSLGNIGGGIHAEKGPNISVSSVGSMFNDDAWHMCTFVHDIGADRISIYVDAYAPWSYPDSSPGDMEHNLNGINIGSYDGSKWFFEGLIDEVAIWNRALSADEILAMFNSGDVCYEFPNTPTGTDITVQPLDGRTLTQPLTMTFAEVTGPGVTRLTTSSSGPEPPAGSNLVGTYYDITTTASFNGDTGVSIDYSGISFECWEEDLRLYHVEDGEWVDVTDLPVDTENNIIRGTVNFLSLFAIFEPENQPPEVGAISAPLEPVQVNTTVEASAGFSDPDIGDTHTATWDWGDGSTSPGTVGTGTVSGTYTYIIPGVYTVTLTLTDVAGASDEAVFQYVVVYDPGAGFVTGGGWIYSPTGALLDSAAEGKASFGFVAKYKKGATVPTGNTEFRFRAGGFSFKSSSYEWLVVAGTKAMFKGEGSIDGMVGSFKFMLTGVDDTEDKFRIKISDPASESPIYDNKRGEGDDAQPTTIGGGSIVIHGG